MRLIQFNVLTAIISIILCMFPLLGRVPQLNV
jgi:hypothetical protein